MALPLWDNPVFLRESRWWRLRGLSRNRARARVTVMVTAVVALFYTYCLWAFWNDPDEELTDGDPSFWFWLLRLLLGMIVILGPVAASPAVARERELRTWEGLAMTRLRGRDILLGKWFGSFSPLCLLIFVSAPLLALAGRLGKIGAREEWATLVFLLTTAGAYTLLGLFCSFLTRKSFTARFLSVTVSLGLCFGTLVLDSVARQLIAPGSRAFSLFDYNRWGSYDYGFFGAPSLSWFSPFFVLSILSEWAGARNMGYNPYSQEGYDDWSAHPAHVLLVYSLSLILAMSVCLYYMLTRYRRDVRGGRPLGEPIS